MIFSLPFSHDEVDRRGFFLAKLGGELAKNLYSIIFGEGVALGTFKVVFGRFEDQRDLLQMGQCFGRSIGAFLWWL